MRGPSRPYVSVPTTREVVPGAAVNIVLKADQPTGRTVSGSILHVLTKGNHPRGIKVRLTDGRVGRVQTMATSAGPGSASASSPGPDARASASVEGEVLPGGPEDTDVGRNRWGNARSLPEALPPAQIGLDAYIKPAKQRRIGGRGKTNSGPAAAASASASASASSSGESADTLAADPGGLKLGTVTCPVCNHFEGDQDAVAHHVANHFGD